MNDEFLASLPYVLLAVDAGVLGSIISLFYRPGTKIRSAIQHFADGAVLAAVASNVIPEVTRTGTLPGVRGGFVAGGLLMVPLKWLVLQQPGNRFILWRGCTDLSHRRGAAGGNIEAEQNIFSTVTLFSGFLALLILKLLG